MNKTCPNCGAPVSGWECDYCGAVFYDFSSIDVSLNKPIFMRFKHEGEVVETRVILTNFNVNSTPEYLNLFCDGSTYSCMGNIKREIDMGFDVVSDLLVKPTKKEE